ncbi:M61 family metallopeptidase [Chamaesiphon sp. OTE_20_metabat_361]|uniref:M61 family metallopeptidase n=1 Tax=Chamaesiphon sp. OTE_20_metabat_361 TaxID=2964689 RepID=UPI00286B81C0|nr:M61 family metallopeptidase [Chamaesiphon sp. OTE_20_metabat_361]
MIQTTIATTIDSQAYAPKLAYRIAMSQPQTHLFEVKLIVSHWDGDILDIKMPVWTPGSYLVREYAKQIQNLVAVSATGRKLGVHKVAKNHWQIQTNDSSKISISYQVFANELTVRTNHLDATHGYFNPAALCFYVPGFENCPIELRIIPPNPDWQVTTPLPQIGHQTFLADDFDTLVDSPFEIGTQRIYDFTVLDIPHQLVVWGEGNLAPHSAIEDIKKIVEVEANIFGGLPYEKYIFLLHLSPASGGGLEHKNCCSLLYPRFNFQGAEKHNRFMQLVAHEFFHLWNVKRIRPAALEKFDYDRENYTPSLWFSEGTTSYYDLVIPRRAGVYDDREFLAELSKEITRFLTTPGRLVQPLSESSFDAWIKLYRPDANSSNSQMSYYLKGEMVTLLLDLLIRDRTQGTKSFDDVLVTMWEQFGKAEIGFTEIQLKQIIESIADRDLTEFYDRYIHGIEELPFNEYLAPFGIELQPVEASMPYLGINVKTEHGKEAIKSVAAHSPAQLAGIDPGDELLAIDGYKITADKLNDRLKSYQPGQEISVSFFHADRLMSVSIVLATPQPQQYQLRSIEQPDKRQHQLFKAWAGGD